MTDVGADGRGADGRRNQKLRTRRALVDAAVELVREGRPVTVADAAHRARVSVATAYRYFSNPQDLLRETQTVARGFEALADLPDDPAERLDLVVSRTADLQLGDEAVWRAVLRAALERWTEPSGTDTVAGTNTDTGTDADAGAGTGAGTDTDTDTEAVPNRNRLRFDLTRAALEPLADSLPPDLHRRLTMAATMVYGVEALVSTRDVCGLGPEESKDVMRWAARALLEAVQREAAERRGED